jgi:hypothetical protein
MEVGSRRILHTNVTGRPTAEWTIQQFREFMAFDHPYRFVIHDHDAIFSARLDSELRDFGVRVLKPGLQRLYRRLTFMMLDADIVAVSPTSVWRVLGQAGLLSKWNGKP